LKIYQSALRIAGNIAAGDDIQTQKLIDAGCLPCFVQLLNNESTQIQKETLWALSNITAGSRGQVGAFISSGATAFVAERLLCPVVDIAKVILVQLSNVNRKQCGL
jgi:hypothetical protein